MARAKKKKASAAIASAAAKKEIVCKRSGKVGDLDEANERINVTIKKSDCDRANQISKLQAIENELLDRLIELHLEKQKVALENGNIDVSDDDLLDINAGGKVIAAKRGTLTQLPGSRLAALFSGRWDKKLIRDSGGRIFMDVNGDCFQAIVDYLNELAISSGDEAPALPIVDDELQHILAQQMVIFGLDNASSLSDSLIESNIVSNVEILHDWLKEDGSDGALELLYCSYTDGLSASSFHSKCDNKGPTVVIIKTTDGDVIGGYTNTSWSSNENYAAANKAFLFALSGLEFSFPFRMKLRNASDRTAIYNGSTYGPSFGQGGNLEVIGDNVTLKVGPSYEDGLFEELGYGCYNDKPNSYKIKEMEVFLVADNRAQTQSSLIFDEVTSVKRFSKEVNDAINNKWKTLQDLEVDVISQEECFKDEATFVMAFASDDSADNIVTLNVSGTVMSTSRETLLLFGESVLAQQFDDSKWAVEGCTDLSHVKDWSPDDVANWVESLKDVPNDIAALFWANEIKGSELLAMSEHILKMVGVKRAGTIGLLMKEIKQLEEASQDTATLIEYSPYCFGKILDHLRLMRLYDDGLIDKPFLPEVCESQQKRFEKIVKYYFPGDSSKFILG